jgi:hypothetical protein
LEGMRTEVSVSKTRSVLLTAAMFPEKYQSPWK